LYGGLAYRYWLGSPGSSELISGTAHFWQAVPEGDREQFLSELRQEVCQRVTRAAAVHTGLLAEVPADRIEWLLLWDRTADTQDRLAAFEQGWSASLPRGTRARDLSSQDISSLVRRAGLSHPRPAPQQCDMKVV
jgi:hypothetical protein